MSAILMFPHFLLFFQIFLPFNSSENSKENKKSLSMRKVEEKSHSQHSVVLMETTSSLWLEKWSVC